MRKEIILSKINEIEESITLIVDNMPDDFEEFENLGLLKDGIYKRIQYIIENILDICAIVLSQNHFPCGNDTRVWQSLTTKR
ncbi:MAG: hypothetical protein AMQ74_01448 [Candidatus Methanofastidiosum methylothiophilum]|uniref:DUF86 domain-containing protein n=1 Tax=Candidatus Methanofastidiosum methylothiophilum TaxID=1705564 RepID=A0A150IWP5_9EURY|nr:MAG: hypothetical protein AMQ74_01448 [Candidatus Methanofastidiosum methylthiophilus]